MYVQDMELFIYSLEKCEFNAGPPPEWWCRNICFVPVPVSQVPWWTGTVYPSTSKQKFLDQSEIALRVLSWERYSIVVQSGYCLFLNPAKSDFQIGWDGMEGRLVDSTNVYQSVKSMWWLLRDMLHISSDSCIASLYWNMDPTACLCLLHIS